MSETSRPVKLDGECGREYRSLSAAGQDIGREAVEALGQAGRHRDSKRNLLGRRRLLAEPPSLALPVQECRARRRTVIHLTVRGSPDPFRQPFPGGHAFRLAAPVSDFAVLAPSVLPIGHVAMVISVTA